MEVILVQDVPKLGYKGDVVNVRPGFARNYLLPNGYVLVANDANRKMVSENQRQAGRKIEQARNESQALATKLEATPVKVMARTGTSGKIFGSITTLQIAQALADSGFTIDRRKINLNEEIKNVGEYTATIDLHKDVKAKINILVEGKEA